MSNESLYGQTKGTPLEALTTMLAKGEAAGTMMYYALARLAREQGLAEVAEKLTEAANQEANHAGFYAVLSGLYPNDFWTLLHGLQKAEASAEPRMMKFAERFREAGLNQAAAEIELLAKEETHHGEILQELLDKYQKDIDTPGKKVYVCGCCGYEYVGDLDGEPEDYVCPVCGQPKKVFRRKEA